MDTGDLIQEYDYHLAAVNTITFVDEGRRFVSTSDDKTIRVWEYGIPVQIKYIADPGMHSIPAITMHPNNQYFIGQSMDNQIVTYSARDKFRQNRKKVFKVRICSHLQSLSAKDTFDKLYGRAWDHNFDRLNLPQLAGKNCSTSKTRIKPWSLYGARLEVVPPWD